MILSLLKTRNGALGLVVAGAIAWGFAANVYGYVKGKSAGRAELQIETLKRAGKANAKVDKALSRVDRPGAVKRLRKHWCSDC